MTPQTIAAIAYLIAEAAAAGVSIAQILRQARATGRVPPETWEAINRDLAAAIDEWKASGG